MNRTGKVLIVLSVLSKSILSASPVINSSPITSATEDIIYSYTASATDADNDAMTWAVKSGTTLPDWLTFSSSGSSATSNFVTGITSPGGIGFDENTGYTYFAVTDANGTIYKADANGNKTVFGTVGSGNPFPVGNMIISGTTLYVSCYSADKIVKFDLSDQSGNATPTTLATLNGPVGMALKGGELYVATYDLSKIVKVNMSNGVVTDFYSVQQPFGLVFDSNDDCYISLFNARKVLKRTAIGDTSTVAVLPSSTSDIKIGKNGKFYVSQRDAADFRIYESDFSTYQSIAIRSWGMTFTSSGTLIFGEFSGTRLLKLETGAVLYGTPTNDDVGTHNVALSVSDGNTTVNQEFTITVANTNDAPTSSNNTVALTTQYTFSASDFTFSDIDPTSDTLTNIKISAMPGAGALKYFNINTTVNKVIPIDSIGQLVYVPVTGGNGIPYSSFGFQVGDGTAFSSTYTMTFNVTAIPVVSTTSATSISTTSAVLGGNVSSNGSLSITERGIVYSITDSTPETGESGVTTDINGTGTGSFSESVGSLMEGTKYYVRAYASNSVGTGYGATITFTTFQVPSVTTQAVSSITKVSATANGNIIITGIPDPTSYGFCWNTSGNPDLTDSVIDKGAVSIPGTFNANLTGLSAGTTYYVRAYAINSADTIFGTQVSFTTLTPQTITFDTLVAKTYGDDPFELGAAASSGLTIIYFSSNSAVATVSGDTVTIVGAGNTTITASQSGNSIYEAAPSVNHILNVNSKSLTVTGLSGVDKSYDGTDSATISGTAVLTGVESIDENNVILGGTPSAVFADAQIGSDKTITVTGYTISGPASVNYTLIQPTIIADITGKPVTIAGLSAIDKVYDGTVAASLSGTPVLTGVESGDLNNVTLVGTPVATFADATAGKDKAIIITGYSISGSAAGIYTLMQPEGVTADISAKELTVIGIYSANKIYDGTTTASISGTAKLLGVIAFDAANVLLSGTPTANFSDEFAGTHKTIIVTGLNLSGSASGNYSLAEPNGLRADITAKVLTITGLTGVDKTYNGTTAASVSGVATLNGVLTADAAGVILGGTPVADFGDVLPGTDKPITVTGYTISGSAAVNYNLTQPQNITADIFPVQLNSPVITSQFNDTDRVGSNVRLSWASVDSALGYRIQISHDSLFTTMWIDTPAGNITKLFVNDLGADSIWYFRVAAYRENVTGVWSEIYHFTTLPPETAGSNDSIDEITIQIADSVETLLPGVSIYTDIHENTPGAVLTLVKNSNYQPDTSIAQASPVYDFSLSTKTKLQDSITIAFTIPDTFMDGSVVSLSDMRDFCIYEIDSEGTRKTIYNAIVDTAAGSISYRTDRLSAVTLALDRVPPTITDNTPRVPTISGSTPSITGHITDNIKNCRAFAYFRKGGAYEYDSLPVEINEDGSFSLSVNNTELDLNGFEYFIAAFDGSNRVTVDRQDIPVKVTAVTDSPLIPSMQWQLFSTPVNLSTNDISSFFRNMGEYGSEWKLFQRSLAGTVDSFIEYGPNLNSLGTGFSYWIKSYRKVIQLAADSGITTPVSRCYEMVIPSKSWASVGNPYTFPVGWQNIIDSTGATAVNLIGPYTYEDSAWIPPSQIDKIVPWRGYYVYNSSDSAITMRIPSLRYRESQSLAKQSVYKNLTSLEWIVSSKDGRDYRNYFGFSPSATEDYDVTMDFPKAGVPESNAPVFWFNRQKLSKVATRFQTDFTSMKNGGEVWTSAIGKLQKGTSYHCEISGLGSLPDSIQCLLVDKHAGITQDMRKGIYTFVPLEKESVREMELIVGTAEYVNGYIKGVKLPPQKMALSAMPRHGSFIINYALPWNKSAVPVRIDIIDLQGRIVSTLLNEKKQHGNYSVYWNTRRSLTTSGVYLIRLKAGEKRMIVKGHVIR